MFPAQLAARAEQLLDACRARNIKVATAESCTGGLIAGCLTAVAGASDVVERGFVTYSNEAKTEMLGVPGELIERVGAVSEEVSRAMAEGALENSAAQLSLAVTGIAGPGGGSDEKPVGTVYLAWQFPGIETVSERFHFHGNRDEVRRQSVATALSELARLIQAASA